MTNPGDELEALEPLGRRDVESLEEDAELEVDPEVARAELERLRKVLMGPDRARLDSIQRELDDEALHARRVSATLPRAITLRGDEDPALASALRPTLESSLRRSVKRDPKFLVDAIFPIIGPAIRKAIAASLRGIVESFNETLESSLTWRGLKWRLEARRTGRTYGEVVLLHSFVYRIEQVLLFHRETSLVLNQVALPTAEIRAPEIVAGLLAAIGDFASEGLGATEGQRLEQLSLEDLRVVIEQGPSAYAAAIVRGHPPEAFRTRLRETLEQVHAEFATDLARFDGDAASFASAEVLLEPLLEVRRVEGAERSKSRFGGIVGVVLALVALMIISMWGLTVRGRMQRFARAEAALRDEPGIQLLHSERHGAGGVLVGSADPLARRPAEVLADRSLDPEAYELRFATQMVADDAIDTERVRRALPELEDTGFRVEDATLFLIGEHTNASLRAAEQLVRYSLWLDALDLDEARNSDALELERATAAIARRDIRFHPGTSTPTEDGQAELASLRATVLELDALARAARVPLELDVLGAAGELSDSDSRAELALERAGRVVAFLEGVDPASVRIRADVAGPDVESPPYVVLELRARYPEDIPEWRP